MHHASRTRHQTTRTVPANDAARARPIVRVEVAVLALLVAHAVIVAALWLRPAWSAAVIGTIAAAIAVHAAARRRTRRRLLAKSPPGTRRDG
jgi:protein-S-isoprenylcysteine O-methyltransferase Ste14